MTRFRVSVAKDYLSFSAAHFITVPGHKCESLHGHNYLVSVGVSVAASTGVDAETGFVVDFAVLKRVLRPAIESLDHKVLLPTSSPKVELREVGDQVRVEYGGGTRFVFPRSNVAPVPVTNTTAELLAEYLAHEVARGLAAEGVPNLAEIEVEVEESPGQSGSCRLTIGD